MTQPLFELQAEEIVVKEEVKELLKSCTNPDKRVILESVIRMIELFQEADAIDHP